MLSPKHKQEIKKLLQKVYQQPQIHNKKKNSPAQRFLLGSSLSQKGAQSRQSSNINRATSSNSSAQRHKSPQSKLSSNSRVTQIPNQMHAQKVPISQIFTQANLMMTNPYQSTHFSQTPKSPSGGGYQGQQGDPKYNENRQYYHDHSQKQGKGPATYDSNTLKQLLADAANTQYAKNYQKYHHPHAQQSKLVGSSAQWDNIAMGIGSYKQSAYQRDGSSNNMSNKQNDHNDYRNGFHQPLGGDIVTVHSGLGDEQIAQYQLENIANNYTGKGVKTSNKLHSRSDNGKEYHSRGSQQLKKALFDYYLQKQLERQRSDHGSNSRYYQAKSDAEKYHYPHKRNDQHLQEQVYEIQRQYANDILNQLGLMNDSNSDYQDSLQKRQQSNNNNNNNKDHYDTSEFIGIDERSQSQRKKYKTIHQKQQRQQQKQQQHDSQSSVDYDPLPDPPFTDQERPPYYNERIQQELVEFKKEIQYRFKHSQLNKQYTFPRTQKNYLKQQREKKQRKKLEAEREQLRKKQRQLKKRQIIQQRWKEIADQAISAAKVAATQEARRLIQEERRYAPNTRNTMPTNQRYISAASCYQSPRRAGSKTVSSSKRHQVNDPRRQMKSHPSKNRGMAMTYQEDRTLPGPLNYDKKQQSKQSKFQDIYQMRDY